MNLYSTCAGCGDLLHVTDGLDYHNGLPPCEPKRTKSERLTAEWLAAATIGDDDTAALLEAELAELDKRPPRLGAAAAVYAQWGWPVFPLRAGAKTPATRNGFKDATTDLDQIAQWWKRNPAYNIGIPTGIAFDAIDIDVPTGVTTYHQMVTDDILPDIHGMVSTSSGGLHLYVEPTGRGNRADGNAGVDYRGVGGYVVAPPSTLGEWRSWSWISKPSPIITGGDKAAA